MAKFDNVTHEFPEMWNVLMLNADETELVMLALHRSLDLFPVQDDKVIVKHVFDTIRKSIRPKWVD